MAAARQARPDAARLPPNFRRRAPSAHQPRPNAHATISGNSSLQNASPCDPMRSVMTTSAPASRSASAHRVGVLEEERLLPAGDEVRARQRRSASRPAVGSLRPATRRRPRRRCRDGEAPWRVRALHWPRHRTPRFGRRAARRRSATAPIGARPRQRTSRVPRTVQGQRRRRPCSRPVSTHGAGSVSSSRRCAPMIIVGGRSAASRTPPHDAINWPSPAKTMASGGAGGTYAVTCRPPSYSKRLGDDVARCGRHWRGLLA